MAGHHVKHDAGLDGYWSDSEGLSYYSIIRLVQNLRYLRDASVAGTEIVAIDIMSSFK